MATLIKRYDKKIILFQEGEINWNFTGYQVLHFMIVLIPYINLLNLSVIRKMSIFEENGAFKDGMTDVSQWT